MKRLTALDFYFIFLIIAIIMIGYYTFIDSTPVSVGDSYPPSSWCSGIYCD